MKLLTLSIAAMLVSVGAHAQQAPPAQPSTTQTEGTAADRTKPGETLTQGAAREPAKGSAAQRDARRSEIVGAPVVSVSNAPLGTVVDVVFDATNRPEFVVIQSESKSTAVPYSAASSMKKADKIVVEQARLQAAPKVGEGAWRNPVSNRWKQESTRYWGRG